MFVTVFCQSVNKEKCTKTVVFSVLVSCRHFHENLKVYHKIGLLESLLNSVIEMIGNPVNLCILDLMTHIINKVY